jgi:hypothetical protein
MDKKIYKNQKKKIMVEMKMKWKKKKNILFLKIINI